MYRELPPWWVTILHAALWLASCFLIPLFLLAAGGNKKARQMLVGLLGLAFSDGVLAIGLWVGALGLICWISDGHVLRFLWDFYEQLSLKAMGGP